LNADIISRVTSTSEQATQLTALLRAAQDPNGAWNWTRIIETSADMISR
jgi:hypothetical protein